MAAIIKEPLQRLIAAYEPIQYAILVGEDADKLVPSLEVEIFINEEKYGRSLFPTPSASLRTDSAVAYTYAFNIAERIQTYFVNDHFFNKDASEVFESDAWQCEFQIQVYEWKQNDDDVLERAETFVQSQRIIAVNAVEQVDNLSVVEDFTFYRSDGVIPFFTYKPNHVTVSLNDHEYLSVWSYFVSHIKFVSYAANDIAIQTAYLKINENAGAQKLLRVGVGPKNINAYTMSEGNILITKNVAYYTIEGGIRCNAPDNWVASTVVRQYWVDTQDATTYRLHFIEETGTQASVSIQVNKKESLKVNSESFERARPQFGSVFDASRARVKSMGIDRFQFVLQNMTSSEVYWLRSIVMTASLFWEKDDLYIPLIVIDGTFTIIDSDNPVNELKFTAEMSTQRSSQRN